MVAMELAAASRDKHLTKFGDGILHDEHLLFILEAVRGMTCIQKSGTIHRFVFPVLFSYLERGYGPVPPAHPPLIEASEIGMKW